MATSYSTRYIFIPLDYRFLYSCPRSRACFILFGVCVVLSYCFTVSQMVSFEQGEKLAATHGVRFLETSAREDVIVTQAFEGLATDVIQR